RPRPSSRARPSSTRWSPTCRAWAGTRRREASSDFRNRDRSAAGAVHRRLDLGLEPGTQDRVRAGGAAAAGRGLASGQYWGEPRMSMGWTWYVIALVALNIVGYVWLLWWTSRRRPGDPKPEDTLHTWDGDITEYNKPLPRWWINLFYLTIIFSIGYLIWYPGLGNLPGVANWTSAGEHDRQRAANDARLEETFAVHAGQPIPVLARNEEALALGRSIFANTCATCHGSTAQGAVGYPDLTDGHWNWGGEPEDILTSILDGREGIMPGWESVLVGMGGDQAMTQIVAYTR